MKYDKNPKLIWWKFLKHYVDTINGQDSNKKKVSIYIWDFKLGKI